MTTTTETKFAALTPEVSVVRIELPSAGLIIGNRQIVKQQIVDLIAEGKRAFVLDFTHCEYVDSAGAGALVSVAKKVRDVGGELVLEHVNDDLVTLFELTKLDSLFTVRRAVP